MQRSTLPPTQVNGFTGERTTTFYGSLELGRRVRRSPTAAAAESRADADCRADVREGCARFGALFSRVPLALPVVRQEVGRVDEELRETSRSPSRGLIELGALKARALSTSPHAHAMHHAPSTMHHAPCPMPHAPCPMPHAHAPCTRLAYVRRAPRALRHGGGSAAATAPRCAPRRGLAELPGRRTGG